MNPDFYVVADIESTGLNTTKAQILKACFIILDREFEEVRRRTWPIRFRYWDASCEDSVKIHGITRDMASSFPSRAKQLPDMAKFIPDNSAFVCHSNMQSGKNYDFAVIKTAFFDYDLDYRQALYFELSRKCRSVLSTHFMARKYLTLTGYSLDKVCHELGISLKHHEVESDTEACAAILRNLGRRYNILQDCEEEYEKRTSGATEERKKGSRNQSNRVGEESWVDQANY